jgi:hypothetical protein
MQRLIDRDCRAALGHRSVGGFAFLIFFLVPQCFSEQVGVESAKNSGDLVELCADLHRANLSQIETWTGRA